MAKPVKLKPTKICSICKGTYGVSFFDFYFLGRKINLPWCEGCLIQFKHARGRLLRKIVMFFYELDDTDPLPWHSEFWWYHPKPWEKDFWRKDD